MGKRIVITGGCGFIGRALATKHIGLGDNVIIIDNLSTGVVYDKCKVIKADLSEPGQMPLLEQPLARADIVYHLASSVGVKYVDNHPKQSLRNSLHINLNIFPLFEKYSNRVIFASTSEVYGDTNEAKETDKLQIGSPDVLRWGYSCCKLMSEFLLKTYSFPSTVVRFFNVTGKGQLHEYGMVLPTFINDIKNNRNLTVYGDGNQFRTFCDIRDAVEMLIILTNDEHTGETYNIGNPQNTLTINQLARNVLKICACDLQIDHKEYAEEFSDQFGEIYMRKPNTDKVGKYYSCQYNIDDIIMSML